MGKLIEWFKISNRYKHCICGLMLFILFSTMYLLGHLLVIGGLSIITKLTAAIYLIYANLNILMAMCAVEYIQKMFNGKFDWLDVLAGMFPSIALSLIIIIISIIV